MESLNFKQQLILTIVAAVIAGCFVVYAAVISSDSKNGGVVMGGITVHPSTAYAVSNGGEANANVNNNVQDNRIYTNGNGTVSVISNSGSITNVSTSSSSR